MFDSKTKRHLDEVEKNSVELFKNNPEATRKAFENMLGMNKFTPNWKAHGFKSREDAIKNAMKAVEKLL